jgi:hypothetical protein
MKKPLTEPQPPRRRAGRPRLAPEELQARIADYCKRYAVVVSEQGLPPFPAGQRETPQHREWMALYKAHRRLSGRVGGARGSLAAARPLLTAQSGCCPVCRKPLELRDARVDVPAATGSPTPPAAVHGRCLQLIELARALGPDALDRAKDRSV